MFILLPDELADMVKNNKLDGSLHGNKMKIVYCNYLDNLRGTDTMSDEIILSILFFVPSEKRSTL